MSMLQKRRIRKCIMYQLKSQGLTEFSVSPWLFQVDYRWDVLSAQHSCHLLHSGISVLEEVFVRLAKAIESRSAIYKGLAAALASTAADFVPLASAAGIVHVKGFGHKIFSNVRRSKIRKGMSVNIS